MIIQGRFVDKRGERYGQVSIVNGVIVDVNIGNNNCKADIIFDDNCIIFPGFGDLHTHLRWGQEYKEDYSTGSLAAINGGVSFLADMPNNPVPPTTQEIMLRKREEADKALLDVHLFGAVGYRTEPIQGIDIYKVYINQVQGVISFSRYEALEETLQNYQGKKISFHCQDVCGEAEAIRKVIEICKRYDILPNICHVSTKAGLEVVLEAKQKGVRVACEVTPHHLFFDDTNTDEYERKTLMAVNPPIRKREDRLFLLENLRSGKIDFLATDHAPHTLEEKLDGVTGLTGLDTYGPFVTWLIEQDVSLEKIPEVCSYNPAQFLGIKQGLIESGYVASFTVLNLSKPTTVTESYLKTKCKLSPFIGQEFPGSVEATIIKGKVYKNARL